MYKSNENGIGTSACITEAQFYSYKLSLTCKPTGTIALVSENIF